MPSSLPSTRHPRPSLPESARAIVANWRALTTPPRARRRTRGGRTLIACSAGADSSALAIALASASRDLVIGHVVHDLRPEADVLADRDAARDLAAKLARPFAETRIRVRAPTTEPIGDRLPSNVEARARTLRYRALAQMAREHDCAFIATAHHAQDQLETMLMALLRGSGLRGLAAIAPSRKLYPDLTLIRPMLGGGASSAGSGRSRRSPDGVASSGATAGAVTRHDCEDICRAFGWTWREDRTNSDTTLLRNALRHDVLPRLDQLRPGAAVRASHTATLIRDAHHTINRRARLLARRAGRKRDGSLTWPRSVLRSQPASILSELLRHLLTGRTHIQPRTSRKDAVTSRPIASIVRAIRDHSTDPRTFTLARRTISVTARTVDISQQN